MDQVLLPELPRRHVDAYHHRRQAGVLPRLVLSTGFAQHPIADRHDQAAFLSQRNELHRRDHAKSRMIPTNQRFDREDAPCAQIDLRLIVQDELGSGDGVSQFLLQQEFPVDLGVQFGRIELEIVAADFLRAVHRRVGVGHQRVGVAAVVGIVRDPDAARHSEIVTFKANRLADRRFGYFARSRRWRPRSWVGRRERRRTRRRPAARPYRSP